MNQVGSSSVHFEKVSPRDVVSTLARLERERDWFKHNARAAWTCAYLFLAASTILGVWLMVLNFKGGR